jgi:cation diffusion facilitator CzcD-associated flavoprotein CzcO
MGRRIAIVGSGFAGLCLAIHLKKLGTHTFVIFEKADRIGGTWRENTYPGAECDVPSALYSFSFERNPNWTYKWSEQKEILAYLEHCARKHDIHKHVRFNEEVKALQFQTGEGRWRLETSAGAVEEFDVVVSAVGQLHKPSIPSVPGASSFQGPAFHSARWNHDVALAGKNVCCIGNAASAAQFIPRIAPAVRRLTVFQRSANWILPKMDREYASWEKRLVNVVPPLLGLYRFGMWLRSEALLYPLMREDSKFLRSQSEKMAIGYLHKKIQNPELRKKLVPDYPMGAKRILFSDDFYDAIGRDNVTVATEVIDRITPQGVVTAGEHVHDADVLVYATGFETTSFLTPMQVRGLESLSLNEKWAREGAEAYLGITHTGFPNFFMMYGPNTNLGHNSVVVMMEAQTRYILSCLQNLETKGTRWLDVKPEVQERYNKRLQEMLQKSAWASANRSWYKNEQGKITNNWAGRTTEYRRRTKAVNPDDYEFG